MNILVTLNAHYLKPLLVMLKSLFYNNPGEHFTIYLMHSSIPEDEIRRLQKYIRKHEGQLEVLYVEDHVFHDAPVLLHYTKEMYYRLLACKLLPEDVDKILYLDPDLLVLNPVKAFYDTDCQDQLNITQNNQLKIPHK